MVRKKSKAISFDAMVKFFMQNYDIPTKKDVDRLVARLDRLENLIRVSLDQKHLASAAKMSRRRAGQTAVEQVLGVIKRSKKGLGFSDIQAKTGFGDKKIRNIIFRLNKLGKIKRLRRGVYVAT
jgi:hypothetical protein